MGEATVLFAKALDFAVRKHVHRRRDTGLVPSGLLHDAIEDTDTSLAEPAAEFGQGLGAGSILRWELHGVTE